MRYGQRTRRRFRLGDRVRATVVRVDLQDVPVGELRGRQLALAMRLAGLAQKVPDKFVSRPARWDREAEPPVAS